MIYVVSLLALQSCVSPLARECSFEIVDVAVRYGNTDDAVRTGREEEGAGRGHASTTMPKIPRKLATRTALTYFFFFPLDTSAVDAFPIDTSALPIAKCQIAVIIRVPIYDAFSYCY